MANQIYITDNILDYKAKLLNILSEFRVVEFVRDDFLVDDTREVLKEALLSTEIEKYILLCAKRFNIYAQNAMLKLLEEPPSRVNIIIITESKSSLLPTIRSRVPSKIVKEPREILNLEIDINSFGLKELFEFIKKNQNISRDGAKSIIEALLFQIQHKNLSLQEQQLELFSNSIKLLNLNSKPINILTTIFLSLINREK